jgi:polyhydroxyalkanoate synthase
MYLNNKLIKPNAIRLSDTSLNLKSIKTPSYFLSAQQDHITPWKSTYSALSFYGGPSTFVLTSSGHVAGIVNPPINHKYCYYTHEKFNTTVTRPSEAEEFIEQAKKNEGSWWTHWEQWLCLYSGKLISSRDISVSSIEKAPGTYVRQ